MAYKSALFKTIKANFFFGEFKEIQKDIDKILNSVSREKKVLHFRLILKKAEELCPLDPTKFHTMHC